MQLHMWTFKELLPLSTVTAVLQHLCTSIVVRYRFTSDTRISTAFVRESSSTWWHRSGYI